HRSCRTSSGVLSRPGRRYRSAPRRRTFPGFRYREPDHSWHYPRDQVDTEPVLVMPRRIAVRILEAARFEPRDEVDGARRQRRRQRECTARRRRDLGVGDGSILLSDHDVAMDARPPCREVARIDHERRAVVTDVLEIVAPSRQPEPAGAAADRVHEHAEPLPRSATPGDDTHAAIPVRPIGSWKRVLRAAVVD